MRAEQEDIDVDDQVRTEVRFEATGCCLSHSRRLTSATSAVCLYVLTHSALILNIDHKHADARQSHALVLLRIASTSQAIDRRLISSRSYHLCPSVVDSSAMDEFLR